MSPRRERAGVELELLEQGGVGRERDLHHLGEARRALARGQRREVREVGHDGARLMERADEVLPDGVVEAGLSPDRRVDHREQRRGDLHEAHAAQQARRREAREVADDPAAGRDHHGVAVDARAERRVPDGRRRWRASCATRPGGRVTRVIRAREGTQARLERRRRERAARWSR